VTRCTIIVVARVASLTHVTNAADFWNPTGESAAGVSPAAARRTVRKPLGLHGSHRPASGLDAESPVGEEVRGTTGGLGQ
jgi:hypothetical protein